MACGFSDALQALNRKGIPGSMYSVSLLERFDIPLDFGATLIDIHDHDRTVTIHMLATEFLELERGNSNHFRALPFV